MKSLKSLQDQLRNPYRGLEVELPGTGASGALPSRAWWLFTSYKRAGGLQPSPRPLQRGMPLQARHRLLVAPRRAARPGEAP
jgi:predicted cobalt transporter CbtA